MENHFNKENCITIFSQVWQNFTSVIPGLCCFSPSKTSRLSSYCSAMSWAWSCFSLVCFVICVFPVISSAPVVSLSASPTLTCSCFCIENRFHLLPHLPFTSFKSVLRCCSYARVTPVRFSSWVCKFAATSALCFTVINSFVFLEVPCVQSAFWVLNLHQLWQRPFPWTVP